MSRKVHNKSKGLHFRGGSIFVGGVDQIMGTVVGVVASVILHQRGYQQHPTPPHLHHPNFRRRRRRGREVGASGRRSSPRSSLLRGIKI